MQYDLKRDVVEATTVALKWHGDDTRVFLSKLDGEKTLVKTGEVVNVTVEKARRLLRYSNMWTLEKDEPVRHPFDEEQRKLTKRQAKKVKLKKPADDKKEDGDDEDLSPKGEALTPEEVAALPNKKDVVAAFARLEVTVNDRATREELNALYEEEYNAKFSDDKEVDKYPDPGKMPNPEK